MDFDDFGDGNAVWGSSNNSSLNFGPVKPDIDAWSTSPLQQPVEFSIERTVSPLPFTQEHDDFSTSEERSINVSGLAITEQATDEFDDFGEFDEEQQQSGFDEDEGFGDFEEPVEAIPHQPVSFCI